MIQLLCKYFIKDYKNVKKPAVRTAYGVFGGVLGIVCNVILFIIKTVIGAQIGSIAIISDAFNNLSDIGSSAVTLIGAKLSNQRPDQKHPFGHGRIEYVCSLIVSFIIISVGIELVQSSFGKILSPVKPVYDIVMLGILATSILIKLWMFFAMRYLGNCIDSDPLRATSKDSISDAIATGAVILSVVLCQFLPPIADGIAGMIVAILICITGIRVAWDTINTLLGGSPDPSLAKAISEILLSNEEILGIHDLIVHDYGPGRTLASVHAEVSSEKSAIMLHEIIDMLEVKIADETGVETVIHTDPILVNCPRSNETRDLVMSVISKINSNLGMHDFRMTDGENRINLIFDLEVPFSMTESGRENTIAQITQQLKEENPKFFPVIRIDYKQEF